MWKQKLPFAFIALLSILFLVTCDIDPVSPPDPTPVVPPTGSQPIPYYLGCGYDVIAGSYINRNDVKIAHPILDQKKMKEDNLIFSEAATLQDFNAYVGSTIAQFARDKNAGLSIDLSDNALIALFNGKLSAEFSVSWDSEKDKDEDSYLRGRTFHYTRDEYIKGASAKSMLKYLTDSFAYDLKTMPAPELFTRYGTHVLVRYYKGGALEFNYVYKGKVLTTTDQMRTALNASFFGISGQLSGGTNSERLELEQNSRFHYYSYGGTAISAFSIEDLKSNYSGWLNSISNNADICGIGDWNQCLIPLWELAEAGGYGNKAIDMESEFNYQAVKQGKALLVRKTNSVLMRYDSAGTYTYTFNDEKDSYPATIEVYALGAGGGGQGGNRDNGIISDVRGTGGAGGGGAAAYMKLFADGTWPVILDITVGRGGEGGNFINKSSDESGSPGKDGGSTSVFLASQNINLVVEGGTGGGGAGTAVNGGVSGRANDAALPKSSPCYRDGTTASGEIGTNGNTKKNLVSEGGKAALIEVGSAISFAGGDGARRNLSDGVAAAQNGGGGCSKYGANKGVNGGDGMVYIIVTYGVLK